MKRLPKTLHIRTFHGVALEKSISKASERLSIGKATVSRHISELEIDLGIKLFTRLNRGVELTDAGNELLSIAENLARLAADLTPAAFACLATFYAESNEVSVASVSGTGTKLFAHVNNSAR